MLRYFNLKTYLKEIKENTLDENYIQFIEFFHNGLLNDLIQLHGSNNVNDSGTRYTEA